MSISSEITRISNAKTAIAESIANKGVTVPSGTKIDGMATLIDSIPTGGGGGDTSETWVLNEKPDTSRNIYIDVQIQFVSNGQTFARIKVDRVETMGINYDDVHVYVLGAVTPWVLENYRKVTFATAPTGDLLTWLQSNAIKQASDTAVQPSKALTVTSNGTTTITADAPYDAIKQVDLTVNVAGSGNGFKITFPAAATNWEYVDSSGTGLLLSDGTVKPFHVYSNISGQTVENVIGIACSGTTSYYILKMTLSKGTMAQYIIRSGSSMIYNFNTTTAPNTTPTPYGGGTSTFWWPLSDVVISSIQMYNTD